MDVIISNYVSDTKIVRRSWGERLFSLPWQPLKSTKVVDSATVLKYGGMLIVSPKTYAQLVKDGTLKPGSGRLEPSTCNFLNSLGARQDDAPRFFDR